MRRTVLLTLLMSPGTVAAQEGNGEDAAPPQAPEQEAAEQRPAEEEIQTQAADAGEVGSIKTLSGMSVLGNEEAPKSLVIVPWKSSQLGDGLGVANSIDERARPVDKEVFMREVRYYELRAGAEE